MNVFFCRTVVWMSGKVSIINWKSRFLSSPFSFQSQQMRAVSSPSLCESPLDPIKFSKKPRRDEIVATAVDTHQSTSFNNNNNHNNNNHTSTSVLQKFRKTFSNLKGKSSVSTSSGATAIGAMNGGPNHVTTNSSVANAAPVSINCSTHSMVNASNAAFDNADIIKYRFGPLIWRTSKERRKTKHHRRDKCNSGDSGIQVELENDENLPNDMIDSLDASPSPFNVRVRRANSAKVAASNSMALMARARILKRNDSNTDTRPYLRSIPGRSLSQPYGLNQIAPCKWSVYVFPFVTHWFPLSFSSFSFCEFG